MPSDLVEILPDVSTRLILQRWSFCPTVSYVDIFPVSLEIRLYLDDKTVDKFLLCRYIVGEEVCAI